MLAGKHHYNARIAGMTAKEKQEFVAIMEGYLELDIDYHVK